MTSANMKLLREVIGLFGELGVVFVASAGNERSYEPVFPAALGDPTSGGKSAPPRMMFCNSTA